MMLYRFAHKTGVYGVSIVEEETQRILVKVEQVIKHPKQGDLHNPTDVEDVFFHERKALSQYEKRYTTKSQLRPFDVAELPYTESLQQALSTLETKLLKEDTVHAQKSLTNLQRLKEDYSLQYKKNFI
ncbi:sporulation phosphorelay system protein KapB [Staphylococcus arlettae]|uniref:kinase n=1 Tax=Staphylococcus TaxID=1279 RepID=UPI0004CE1914|nr:MULTISPECIES: kinase [Staphylococcus]MDT4049636.1 sporulation phosphorelay system protein KapB [Staphylococcus arlettae]